MPPLQRPHIDNEGRWHFFNGDLVAWKVSSDGDSFTSGQIFKAKSPHSGMGRKSTATPPYHTHLYQTETFDVQSGTLCYLIDGKEGKLLAGQKTSIPPHRPHTVGTDFWSDIGQSVGLYSENSQSTLPVLVGSRNGRGSRRQHHCSRWTECRVSSLRHSFSSVLSLNCRQDSFDEDFVRK